MNNLKMLLLIIVSIVLHVSNVSAAPAVKLTIMADGHPMALWQKAVKHPKGLILLHHGRTWSALPDFDLQVEGENLSLMDGFNSMGYSVWALDARGYGETPRDKTGWNTPDRAAKDISIVLDWLVHKNSHNKKSEKIHLWGWSMGARLAQLAAQKYPENIQSLTLFGYPMTLNRVFPNDVNTGEPKMEINTAENAASDFIVPNTIRDKAINEYVRHALQADPVRADWNYTHQYNQLDPKKVKMPVLLLQGEFDPLAKDDMYAKVFTDFPNGNKQWLVLKGGDHAALLELPRMRLITGTINFYDWLKK